MLVVAYLLAPASDTSFGLPVRRSCFARHPPAGCPAALLPACGSHCAPTLPRARSLSPGSRHTDASAAALAWCRASACYYCRTEYAAARCHQCPCLYIVTPASVPPPAPYYVCRLRRLALACCRRRLRGVPVRVRRLAPSLLPSIPTCLPRALLSFVFVARYSEVAPRGKRGGPLLKIGGVSRSFQTLTRTTAGKFLQSPQLVLQTRVSGCRRNSQGKSTYWQQRRRRQQWRQSSC